MTRFLGLLCGIAAFGVQAQTTVTTELDGEWAYGYRDNASQKLEFSLKPEVRSRLSDTWDLTAIVRFRWDAEDNLEPGEPSESGRSQQSRRLFVGNDADLELREFYLTTMVGDAFLTLGKQQVVWGKADGLKVLDVVNPQSFREFILDDFEDSRIPLWTVNVEIPIYHGDEGRPQDVVLQLLWIPDPTAHDIPEPDALFAFTSSRIVPAAPAGVSVLVNDANSPSSPISDSDIGMRLSAFWSGWDLSLNYMYRYGDLPILFRRVTATGVEVNPEYRRTHLIGGTFSNAFGNLTLRGELGYTSDAYFLTSSPSDRDGVVRTGETGAVVGLDWFGFTDTVFSLQLFHSMLDDDFTGLSRDKNESSVTFLARRNFWNDTLTAEMLLIHSLAERDSLVRMELSYEYSDRLELWAGLDVFAGDTDGMLGQFDRRDRFVTGFRLGF